MLASIMVNLVDMVDEDTLEPVLELDQANDAVRVGMGDQTAFKCREQARYRKTSQWVNAAVTRDKLLATSIVLRP
eukprot:3442934-Alexandrium_andersonii.AAC.1